MEQRIIYRIFLIIGSILMINSSCEKFVEKDVLIKYNYINKSGKQLQMKVFDANNALINDNEILVDDTLTFEIKTDGGAGPFQFENAHGDSVCVIFIDGRFQSYRKDYDSIFFEKAYEKVKINDQEYHLYYMFTINDYESAHLTQ